MKRFRNGVGDDENDEELQQSSSSFPQPPKTSQDSQLHAHQSLLGPQVSLSTHISRHKDTHPPQTLHTGPTTRRSSSQQSQQSQQSQPATTTTTTNTHNTRLHPHSTNTNEGSLANYNTIAHFPQKRTRSQVGLDTDIIDLEETTNNLNPLSHSPYFSSHSVISTSLHDSSSTLQHQKPQIHFHNYNPTFFAISTKGYISGTSFTRLDGSNITILVTDLTARRITHPTTPVHVTFRLSSTSKYANAPNSITTTRSGRRRYGTIPSSKTTPYQRGHNLDTSDGDIERTEGGDSSGDEQDLTHWTTSRPFYSRNTTDDDDDDDWSDASDDDDDHEDKAPQVERKRRGRPPNNPISGRLTSNNTSQGGKKFSSSTSLTTNHRNPRIQGKLVRSSPHPSPMSSPGIHSDCSELDLRSDSEGNLIDINDPWVSSVADMFSFKFPTSSIEFNAHKGHIPATYLHQIFTEGTFIYGYRGLSIEVDINPTTYHVYILVGYRSSLNDRNLAYRGRGPRIIVDHLTPTEWLNEKRAHTLCEYTYTTDGEIEILGLDQHTLHQLMSLRAQDGTFNTSTSNVVVTTSSNAVNTGLLINTNTNKNVNKNNDESNKKTELLKKNAPQLQHVNNSSVEKASVALETLKTRQQLKQLEHEKAFAKKKETIRNQRANKAAAVLASNTITTTTITSTTTTTTTTTTNTLPPLITIGGKGTPLFSTTHSHEPLDIPQLKQSFSDAQWKRLETLHGQFERNKNIVVKSSDQVFDEVALSSKTNANPNNIYTQHHLVRQFLPSELEDHRSITNRALLDPTIFQNNLLTGVTTFSGAGKEMEKELMGNYYSKRVKLHGTVLNQFGDISLDDEARMRHFSIQDMPSLDAIYYAVARHFPPQSLCTSQQEFINTFDEITTFHPPGKFIGQYQVPTMNLQTSRQEVTFHLYLGSLSDPAINDYHQRIQPLLLHYIDTASYIDSRDHIWEVLFAFQKTITMNKQNANKEPLITWKLVGFTTLYTFHKPPSSHRLRLSQILVLPYSQRAGHGMKILEAVYNLAKERDAYEVNIEDPSIGMQMLRDCCDVKRALEMGYFQHCIAYQLNVAGIDSNNNSNTVSSTMNDINDHDTNSSSGLQTTPSIPTSTSTVQLNNSSSSTLAASYKARNLIANGNVNATGFGGWNINSNIKQPKWGKVGSDGCCVWTAKQIEDARSTLYITKLQCERVMECLCLAQIDPSNEEHLREFRLRVKRRLMQSQKNLLEGLNVEERKKVLQQLFDEEYQQYLTIHRKLRIKS